MPHVDLEAAPRYCPDPVPPYEEIQALSLKPKTTSNISVDQAVLNGK